MTVLLSVTMMLFCLVLTFWFNTELSKSNGVFAIVTSVLFALVAVLLLFWLCKLLNIAKQGFEGQFQAELKRVRNFLVSYSGSFVIRAFALMLSFVYEWPIFSYWYFCGYFTSVWTLVFVFEFLLYNIIPITHLAMIHHRSFKKEERLVDDHNQDFIVASSDTVSVEQSV